MTSTLCEIALLTWHYEVTASVLYSSLLAKGNKKRDLMFDAFDLMFAAFDLMLAAFIGER
jgi:hypothetical protein